MRSMRRRNCLRNHPSPDPKPSDILRIGGISERVELLVGSMNMKETPPHLAIARDGNETPLLPFMNRVLYDAAAAAPAVLHAINPLGEDKVVNWQVFSAQTYGQQPSTVATMDGSLFRSALAFLSNSVLGIPPYVGAREFIFNVGDKPYQCVGMVQNTPGCNWVTITIIEQSQQDDGQLSSESALSDEVSS